MEKKKIPENCLMKKYFIYAMKSGVSLAFMMKITPSMTCEDVKEQYRHDLNAHNRLGSGCLRGLRKYNKQICYHCHMKEECRHVLEKERQMVIPPFLCLSCNFKQLPH